MTDDRTDQPVSLTQHRITVLLVDDQAIIGEALRRMLAPEQDIDFHFCQDPTKAIKVANRIHPTVILQDLVMPEIDGLTLVRYYRANPSTRDVPLIVLSSKEEAVTKAEAFARGANDYLVKLPDRLEIIARIRYHSKGYINLLQRNEAQAQLEKANRIIRKTFGQYLSDDIVDAILETPEGAALGGEKRFVTIMMTDLRGFTAIGERLPAEDVVGIINIYLETMTEIILKYQGTIDEFIGDAIFVIFGAPVLRENDAKRAVACAVEMQLAMEAVNRRCRERGYPEVQQGIGINSGQIVVGNIGSKKRMKYGVVGRNVNLTSRIESYTVGGQIFISENTLDECGRHLLRIDDEMEVMPKGVKKPITIYEVGGIRGEFDLFLPEKVEMDLPELPRPFPVLFTILEGKHAGNEARSGTVVRMLGTAAEISADVTPDKLTNLKISVSDMEGNEITTDLYAKVIGAVSNHPGTFKVQFTSIPLEVDGFLKTVAAQERTS
ncbi:MAG: response regulator [Deltaproteobacteria bacterium]|nr:response regulator [Deltaproteobacteria bacterium]